MRPYITDRSRLITPGITVVRGGEAITIGGSGGRPTASGKTNPSPGRGDPGGRPTASGKTNPTPGRGVPGGRPTASGKTNPSPGRGGPGGRPTASGKTNPSPGRGGPGGRPPGIAQRATAKLIEDRRAWLTAATRPRGQFGGVAARRPWLMA